MAGSPQAVSPTLTGNGPGIHEYGVLVDAVRDAGLLRRRPWYYAAKIVLTLVGFFCAWALFYLVGDTWWALFTAVPIAMMTTQVVFLGHDAGHRQISRSRRVNRLVGLVAGDALAGLSFGWWVPKHNAHHAYPNQVGRDPDVGNGLISFGIVDEGSPACSPVAPGRVAALRARHPRIFFVALLLLQGLGLHVTSIQSVIRREGRSSKIEAILLAGNAALYLAVVFWVLSPLEGVLFVIFQQSLVGLYLGSTFAPNHKGMPLIGHESDLPFVQRQILTGRNVVGGRLVTVLYGGLNYQIEHHLFPTMPRGNFARAQPIVTAFCAEHGMEYRQACIGESYRDVLSCAGTVQRVIADERPVLSVGAN